MSSKTVFRNLESISELDVGKEPHDGACHEMSGRVPKGVKFNVVLHTQIIVFCKVT